MNDIAVSIIVPVYNAERYIERCACSLFEQTLDNTEYLFVNDCSEDKSMDVLHRVMEQYPCRVSQVKIIHHETNKGVAVARNTGLLHASGTYIGWVDSDDWVDCEMFDAMYKTAEITKSDIVWCDFFTCFGNEEKEWQINRQLCDADSMALVRGLLHGKLHGSLCNSIARRQLYIDNEIGFSPEINLMEDKLVSIKLRYYAKKCTYKPGAYYYYNRTNTKSLTFSPENFDKNLNDGIASVQSILSFLETNDKGIDFSQDFVLAKLVFKDYYFHSFSLQGFQIWKRVFSEVNPYFITKSAATFTNKIVGWLIINDYWRTLKLCIKFRHFIKSIYRN